VVIVHGLWMHPITMFPLAQMLRRRGHVVSFFGYSSITRSVEENGCRLKDFLARRDSSQVDIVAHSLGSLVTLAALEQAAVGNNPITKAAGKFVAIAPPFCGSRVGRTLQNTPFLKLSLGKSSNCWEACARHAPLGWDVGVIAGTKSFGAGRIVCALPLPNDGTVALAETQILGAKEELALPETHTGIVFSAKVADLVSLFLKHGTFNPARL